MIQLLPTGAGINDVELALRRLDEEDVDAWTPLLTPQERARADRFHQRDDRRRCLVGRGLLRTMLGRRLQRAPPTLAFGANAYGKPTLAEAGEIAFNVSHSGNYVLVAVGRAEAIGVDVEQIRRDLDLIGVGRQVFTTAELALIAASPETQKPQRFFRQWTFKEAVAKAVGLGLSLDLKRFEITFPDPAPRLVCHGVADLGPTAAWRMQEVAVEEGYCAALAVRPWRPT